VHVIAAGFLLDARPPFAVGAWQDYALVVDNAVQIGALEVQLP
jgi:hypothetical protein